MSEIKEAVFDENWDRVIELAQKEKANAQIQKRADAIKDPEQISIVITGRNGQVITNNYEIQPYEEVEFSQSIDTDREFDEFDFGRRYIKSAPRRIDFNIKVRPKGSGWND